MSSCLMPSSAATAVHQETDHLKDCLTRDQHVSLEAPTTCCYPAHCQARSCVRVRCKHFQSRFARERIFAETLLG